MLSNHQAQQFHGLAHGYGTHDQHHGHDEDPYEQLSYEQASAGYGTMSTFPSSMNLQTQQYLERRHEDQDAELPAWKTTILFGGIFVILFFLVLQFVLRGMTL